MQSLTFQEKKQKFAVKIRRENIQDLLSQKRLKFTFNPIESQNPFLNEISQYLRKNRHLLDEEYAEIFYSEKIIKIISILYNSPENNEIIDSESILKEKKDAAFIIAHLSLSPPHFWNLNQVGLIMEILDQTEDYDIFINLLNALANIAITIEFRDYMLDNGIQELIFDVIEKFQLTKRTLGLFINLARTLTYGPPFPKYFQVEGFGRTLIYVLQTEREFIKDPSYIIETLISICQLTTEIEGTEMIKLIDNGLIEGLINNIDSSNQICNLILRIFCNITIHDDVITSKLIWNAFFLDDIQLMLQKDDPSLIYHSLIILSNLAESNEAFIDVILNSKKMILDLIINNLNSASVFSIEKEAVIAICKFLIYANKRQKFQILENSTIIPIIISKLQVNDIEILSSLLDAIGVLLSIDDKNINFCFEKSNGIHALNELQSNGNIELSCKIDKILNKIDNVYFNSY